MNDGLVQIGKRKTAADERSYDSPRLSSEWYECGLPFTFDHISRCAYQCNYCFAGPIKDAARLAGGLQALGAVDVEHFKHLFLGAPETLSIRDRQIRTSFIDQRLILHWGGLADPFDLHSLRTMRPLTLELLRFLTEIKYPVLFSTKGVLTDDTEILDLFEENRERWAMQHSIITYDADIAAKIEAGVGSPQARVGSMAAVSKRGVQTILRLRPFSPGVSTGTYLDLIAASHDAGARAISTEFLCIPFADFAFAKKKFGKMDMGADFDYVGIYRALSDRKRGQPRLSRRWKQRYVYSMYEETKIKRGWTFGCSDPDFKELNDTDGCCAVGSHTLAGGSITTGTYTAAIRRAFRNGFAFFSEIAGDANVTLDAFSFGDDVRSKADVNRALRVESVYDKLRSFWNKPAKSTISPVNFFGKVMVPVGIDGRGDAVYAFDYRRGLYPSREALVRFGVGPGGLAEYDAQMAGASPGSTRTR